MIARRFAARILLLAALLNALLGLPLHELSHQLDDLARLATAQQLAQADAGEDDTDHEAEACFWCLSHAGAHALGRLPRLPAAPPVRLAAPLPPQQPGFMPAPQHPPFSPRAPPVQA